MDQEFIKVLLIVLSNEIALQVVVSSLPPNRFVILEARSVHGASKILTSKAAVDMLICDLDLQDCDAIDFATNVRSIFPGIPVLFTTDRTEPARVSEKQVIARRFERPYGVMGLKEAIDRIKRRSGDSNSPR